MKRLLIFSFSLLLMSKVANVNAQCVPNGYTVDEGNFTASNGAMEYSTYPETAFGKYLITLPVGQKVEINIVRFFAAYANSGAGGFIQIFEGSSCTGTPLYEFGSDENTEEVNNIKVISTTNQVLILVTGDGDGYWKINYFTYVAPTPDSESSKQFTYTYPSILSTTAKVGIGTTTPDFPLTIAPKATEPGARIGNTYLHDNGTISVSTYYANGKWNGSGGALRLGGGIRYTSVTNEGLVTDEFKLNGRHSSFGAEVTDHYKPSLSILHSTSTMVNDASTYGHPCILLRNINKSNITATIPFNSADYFAEAGNGAIRSFLGSRYDAGATYGSAGTATNHDFLLMTNSTEKVRITADGKVGIGKVPVTDKLEVEGNVATTGNIKASTFTATTGITTPALTTSNITATGTITSNTFKGDGSQLTGISSSQISGIDQPWTKSGSFLYYNIGNIGIGTSTPDALLTVRGVIHAQEVHVDLAGPLADYVFAPSYKLMPLSEVEQYIRVNQHLPEISSANEVKETGLNIGDMQNKLLQKVEELTLYIIEQQKQIEELKKQMTEHKK